MSATERIINDLNIAKLILCNPQTLTPEMCIQIGQAITSSIALLKEQEEIINELQKSEKCVLKNVDTKICKHCKHYGVFPDKEVEPDDNGIRCYCYKHKWLCYPWDECEDFQNKETREGR